MFWISKHTYKSISYYTNTHKHPVLSHSPYNPHATPIEFKGKVVYKGPMMRSNSAAVAKPKREAK